MKFQDYIQKHKYLLLIIAVLLIMILGKLTPNGICCVLSGKFCCLPRWLHYGIYTEYSYAFY